LINRADGNGERQLTNDPPLDRNPTFSPDGQWIAFMSNRSGRNQIWLIRPDGSGLRQATDASPGAWSHNPWSPDGSSLPYTYATTTDMFMFDPRKPWREQSPQFLSSDVDFTPMSWSPDGRQLLGDGGSQGHEQIFAYLFASKQFTRLSEVGTSWTWLRDSRRLLYTFHGKLFVLDSVTKNAREILSVAPDANTYLLMFTLLKVGMEDEKPASESADKRSRLRFLPGTLKDAMRLFKASELTGKILGEGSKEKFLSYKQASANRNPSELGTAIKDAEVIYHHEVTNQYLWNRF